MTEKHYPGSPPPAAAAPAPLDRALVVERLKTLANVKGCEVNARDAEYLRAAAALLEQDVHDVAAAQAAAADAKAQLETETRRARQVISEETARAHSVEQRLQESTGERLRLVERVKELEARLEAAGQQLAKQTAEAPLAPPPATGGVTIDWEPDSNRVVLTYDDAPGSVRVITRRS